MFIPIDENQFKLWKLRRDGVPNINIARSFNISRQAVSRALNSIVKIPDDPTKLAEELFEKLRRLV